MLNNEEMNETFEDKKRNNETRGREGEVNKKKEDDEDNDNCVEEVGPG